MPFVLFRDRVSQSGLQLYYVVEAGLFVILPLPHALGLPTSANASGLDSVLTCATKNGL